MNWWEKIFGKAASEIVTSGGQVIDSLSTSDEEKAIAKEKLTNTVMTHLIAAQQAQASIIVTEATGNWLQRSWRPILMLAFGMIVIYNYFLAEVLSAFLKDPSITTVDLPERFWNLLELGMGGYVIGRTVEKVADTVVKNVDISFVRKKNREVK